MRSFTVNFATLGTGLTLVGCAIFEGGIDGRPVTDAALATLRGYGPGAAGVIDVDCSEAAAFAAQGVVVTGCTNAPYGTPCFDCGTSGSGQVIPRDDTGTQTRGYKFPQPSYNCPSPGSGGNCDSVGSCTITGNITCPILQQYFQQSEGPGGPGGGGP